MAPIPETRISLILRLASGDDVDAWNQFADAYAPAIFAIARRCGLQPNDAEDLVQELLIAVAQAAGKWRPDPHNAKFRTWLFRIAKNLMSDRFRTMKRRSLEIAYADERELSEHCDAENKVADSDLEAAFELEFRRAVYQRAAAKVRERVQPETWQAFVSTSIDQVPIAVVSTQLGLSPGSIYVARSRVIKLLREEAARMLHGDQRLGRIGSDSGFVGAGPSC